MRPADPGILLRVSTDLTYWEFASLAATLLSTRPDRLQFFRSQLGNTSGPISVAAAAAAAVAATNPTQATQGMAATAISTVPQSLFDNTNGSAVAAGETGGAVIGSGQNISSTAACGEEGHTEQHTVAGTTAAVVVSGQNSVHVQTKSGVLHTSPLYSQMLAGNAAGWSPLVYLNSVCQIFILIVCN